MSFVWMLLGTIVGFLWLLRKCYPENYRKHLRLIPGPPKQFLIGNLLDIPSNSTAWAGLLLGWYEKYGSPINLKIGSFSRVHVSKARDVEGILKATGNTKKAVEYRFVKPWLGDGLLLSTGEKWHQRRKMLTPSFHFQILKEFVPVFNHQSSILVSILNDKINSSGKETFDICPFITRCTLDIICETAMGKRINAQRAENSEYVNALFKFGHNIMRRTMSPWLWPDFIFNFTKTGKETNIALSKMHSFTETVIKERIAETNEKQQSYESEPNTNTEFGRKKRYAFLDLLISEMKRTGQIQFQDIREEVDTFMFEGHDTTSTGLAWAIWFIGQYHDMQEKLREEVENTVGDDTLITIDHVSQMHFLERFLKETQRIMPSVPLIGREITEPVKIDDYWIPVGTTVNVSILGLHRNPEYFPDPLKFDPDRFLPENIEGRNPFAFAPFSGGLRNCIGQKFALLEEKIVLCYLIRRFNIQSVQKFDELEPCTEMVLRPSKGILVKLSKISA